MKKILFVALAFVLLGFAASASAQTVINPGHVEYTVSPDHATLTKYTLGFFLPGATDPVQSQDLAIVAPDGTGKVTQAINAVPLTFGTGYTAKLKAVAGAVSGEWSEASNPFSRAPLPPTVPAVKK